MDFTQMTMSALKSILNVWPLGCLFLLLPTSLLAQLPLVISLDDFQENVRIANFEGHSIDVGDLNGDSYADILMGNYVAPSDDGLNVGRVEIVFGGSKLHPLLDISQNSSKHTTIWGNDALDFTGISVASGDINGDGIEDAIIGANQNFHFDGRGVVYIIYGRNSWPQQINLNSRGGSLTGVTRIYGKASQNFLGSEVASGDVNNDGFADVIIGAFGAGPQAEAGREGEVYIFYGADSLNEIVELSTTSQWFTTIHGIQEDRIGEFVGCHDVNSDGFADALVGIPDLNYQSGKVFVVYGHETIEIVRDVYLSTDDAGGRIEGVTQIIGENFGDRIGWRFAGGDINGDGLNDLLIGTYQFANQGRSAAGRMNVLFGRKSFPPIVDLRDCEDKMTVNGSRDGPLDSSEPGDQLGWHVASGDINGDGRADILTSAPYWKVDGVLAGQVFLIYGAEGLPRRLNLGRQVDLSKTVQVCGYQRLQKLGWALASGDINGDDVDDIIASAPSTFTSGGKDGGETYIIYGRSKEHQSPIFEKSQVLQNYPNPFNGYTIIHYQVTKEQKIAIIVYNSIGQQIRILVEGSVGSGEHRAIWDGYNDNMQQVASGVYFCRIIGESFSDSIKLLYLR
jgi:hypothetical protein